MFGVRRFGEVPMKAGARDSSHGFRRAVAAERKENWRWIQALKGDRGSEATHDRHVQVQHGHIRPEGAGQTDCLGAVVRRLNFDSARRKSSASESAASWLSSTTRTLWRREDGDCSMASEPRSTSIVAWPSQQLLFPKGACQWPPPALALRA